MTKLIGSLTVLLAFAELSMAAPAAAPVAGPAARRSTATPAPTPAGRLQTEGSNFNQKSLGPKGYLKPDQIGGCCLMLGTTIRIENLDGKKLSDNKIETFDTFTLSGLKPATAYNLIIIHERYKTPIKLEKVMSGNWVNFKSP